MSEEIFDVVDEQDRVIGQAPRSEVHRRGLNHRAVHVLVFNQHGDLFLQKRSMKKDCFPGVWDSSASGHLDRGEDYDACAVREVREELGVQLATAPERLFRVAACERTGHEFVWVYRGAHEGPFELHTEEIEQGGWFAPAAVERWVATRPGDFAPAFVLIWERWRSESGNRGIGAGNPC
jgi:isopentenyl-diphosphate delta-isomerase type 1